MNFNSISFLIFLPIVVLLYWIVPHKFRWVVLLVASYYFYMSWNAWLVFLILGTTVVSYVSGLIMEKTEKKGVKKLCLISTLVICLGILIFFKYFNFLCSTVIDFLNLFKMNLDTVSLNLILPVGISFYTFQTLSYVIDVYRGKYAAEKHFGYYALFVSYFPQLVAGPIERPDRLIPQLKENHKFSLDDFVAGLQFLIIGFFRKCVVADTLAKYVNNVYGSLETSSGFAVVVVSLLFLVQIYCDFAGYSEIAMGSARIMGVKLTRNFDSPLISKSYTEYFRRWHITLNQWFTDYVYIPLGGNRKGKVRKIINTLIVFALCGLWHGPRWTYVLWGLYGGIFVSVESLLRKPASNIVSKSNINIDNPGIKVLRMFLLMVSFIPGCILFRASNMGDVWLCFKDIFTNFGSFASLLNGTGLKTSSIVMIGVFIVCLALINYFAPDKKREREQNNVLGIRDMAIFLFLIIAISSFWMAHEASSDSSAFAYFQF